MILWTIRILVLAASPIISYYTISGNLQGILIGLAAALLIIGVELTISLIPLDTIVAAILGAMLGLIGAKLLDYMVYLMNNQQIYEWLKQYSILIKVILAYLGLVLAVTKKSELDLLDRDILKKHKKGSKNNDVIILDTSAIIDGRVTDIVQTKFITGTLVTPRFVLRELQGLADSSDAHKRNRARRGLDVIAQLQKEESVSVKIFDKDYPELNEVDAKILQLAKDLDAKILTTDFNLNKVASLHGAVVLNINDLSNSLKPVYLPGEKMPVFVVKDGKEHSQGIGYLDDGTMVVVEDGRKAVGKRIEVIVNSILQTSSGRMIFTHTLDGQGNKETREHREGKY